MTTPPRSRSAGFAARAIAPRVIAWLALLGQLALLADGASEHVTCALHGDLVHATTQAPTKQDPPRAAVVDVAAVSASDVAHDRCLVDEDGEVAYRPVVAALPVPSLVESTWPCVSTRARPAPRRAPLYRLAPKNSPPA